MAIIAENVSKRIGRTQIITNASLHCSEHMVYGLLGSNGAGKTSLLRILNGFYSLDSGKVSIHGLNPYVDIEHLRAIVGISTEESRMYPDLTGAENLRFYASFYQDMVHEEYLMTLTEALNLTAFLDKKYMTYSAGTKKKIEFVRALMHRPKVIFLDEPFANVDPEGVAEIKSILHWLKKTQLTTLLLNTHDLHHCQDLCDSVGLIFRGKIIAEGNAQELLRQYRAEALDDLYFKVKENARDALLQTDH